MGKISSRLYCRWVHFLPVFLEDLSVESPSASLRGAEPWVCSSSDCLASSARACEPREGWASHLPPGAHPNKSTSSAVVHVRHERVPTRILHVCRSLDRCLVRPALLMVTLSRAESRRGALSGDVAMLALSEGCIGETWQELYYGQR